MIAAALFLAGLTWIWKRRRFLLYFLFFPTFVYTFRMVNIVYLDIAGPVLAIEFFRDLGGGNAAPWFLASTSVVFGILLVVYRGSVVQGLATTQPPASDVHFTRVSNFVLALYVLFAASLFLDMAMNGFIPVAIGMERWVYLEDYAGRSHHALHKYTMHLSFYLGLFYWYPMIRGGSPDNRFLAVLLSIMFYLFLAGHRFSAFFALASYFVMVGALPALKRQAGRLPPPVVSVSRRRRARALQAGALVAVFVLVAFALYRSYTFTRFVGREAALFGIEQRLLVQQGELFVATYERVFVAGDVDPANAWDKLFVNPVSILGRNTTTPFLMELELGEAAHPIIEAGVSYTGGYPEVLFELLGKWGGFLGVAAMALPLALLSRMLLRLLLQERFLSVFFTFYVLYPFLLFHVTGMLNFLGWKYFLKLAAFVIWLAFEEGHRLAVAAPQPAGEPA